MTSYEKKREEYADEHRYNKHVLNKNVDPEYVFDEYHRKIKPFLSIITDFKLHDKDVTEKQLKVVLGVSHSVWLISKNTFPEFKDALNAKKSVMKLKAQLDLQKGLINTGFKNPKMIEMQGLRFDDEWKTKSDKEEVALPKTIEVITRSHRLSDEERISKSEVKEE